MRSWVKSGSPWIWLTAASVAIQPAGADRHFTAAGRAGDALFLA
jgi:hypothetical protein